ncbi:MAG: pinensin family lanthipeptide [Bacteroidota bacterium]
MKTKKLNLSQLRVSSFITSVAEQQKVKGGTICPDISLAGPTLCITGEVCETLVVETCHSTGNTDNSTGLFSDRAVCEPNP